jgi:Uma2 family endonuclease
MRQQGHVVIKTVGWTVKIIIGQSVTRCVQNCKKLGYYQKRWIDEGGAMTVLREKLATLDEFEAFIRQTENANRRFELIHGEIVEKLPTEELGVLAGLLTGELYIYLKQNPIGRLAVEPRHQMPEDQHNARLPDVAVTLNERALPLVKKGAVPQMPDLCIEIQSPDDTPLLMREKALYYLKNGAKLVWLLFPRKEQIEVHTADVIMTLGIDDVLDGGELLSGFRLPLIEIFRK